MNILLIGGGGREHALAVSLAQSPTCADLYVAPGNPGIARHAQLASIDWRDASALLAFCQNKSVALVVVGPEQPLVEGVADFLRRYGIAVFGPSAAAARLEGSKAFTKALCVANGIPTAAYERHDRLDAAVAALDRFGLPVVVKADGLAAGKGVTVATTHAEAVAALDALFGSALPQSDNPELVEGLPFSEPSPEEGQAFDKLRQAELGTRAASAEVVIEAFLDGEEVSLFAISDGTTALPFGTAQDHKRVGDGDTGPNTGGMGAYSPATVLTPALEAEAFARIIQPTIDAMRAAGTPFVGMLYAGLMLTADGPQLIEYNVRLGDPEAQVLLPRFDGDLAALFLAAATGKLAGQPAPAFTADTALTVVLASQGYPDASHLGEPVTGLDDVGDAQVFIAGARDDDAVLRTSGGRILAVTALGPDVTTARERVYAGIARIACPGSFYRHDIGWREIARSDRSGDEAA